MIDGCFFYPNLMFNSFVYLKDYIIRFNRELSPDLQVSPDGTVGTCWPGTPEHDGASLISSYVNILSGGPSTSFSPLS